MFNRQDPDFGGRRSLRFGGGMLTPFILTMIIANGAIFFIQALVWPQITPLLGLTPARFLGDFPNHLYQLGTYMFLHGGLGHILFNMFALWMFGSEIERSLGTKSFARLYLLSGIAGGLLHLIVANSQAIPMIGASGAVYGVLAAYWVMFPNREVYIYFLFPVKVKYFVPALLILGFLFGSSGVAHWAHFGGALMGFVLLKADWRWIAWGRKLKNLKAQRTEAKLAKRREEATRTMQRVDEILDKINAVGIENLTSEERKFLEEASSNLSGRKKEGRHG